MKKFCKIFFYKYYIDIKYYLILFFMLKTIFQLFLLISLFILNTNASFKYQLDTSFSWVVSTDIKYTPDWNDIYFLTYDAKQNIKWRDLFKNKEKIWNFKRIHYFKIIWNNMYFIWQDNNDKYNFYINWKYINSFDFYYSNNLFQISKDWEKITFYYWNKTTELSKIDYYEYNNWIIKKVEKRPNFLRLSTNWEIFDSNIIFEWNPVIDESIVIKNWNVYSYISYDSKNKEYNFIMNNKIILTFLEYSSINISSGWEVTTFFAKDKNWEKFFYINWENAEKKYNWKYKAIKFSNYWNSYFLILTNENKKEILIKDWEIIWTFDNVFNYFWKLLFSEDNKYYSFVVNNDKETILYLNKNIIFQSIRDMYWNNNLSSTYLSNNWKLYYVLSNYTMYWYKYSIFNQNNEKIWNEYNWYQIYKNSIKFDYNNNIVFSESLFSSNDKIINIYWKDLMIWNYDISYPIVSKNVNNVLFTSRKDNQTDVLKLYDKDNNEIYNFWNEKNNIEIFLLKDKIVIYTYSNGNLIFINMTNNSNLVNDKILDNKNDKKEILYPKMDEIIKKIENILKISNQKWQKKFIKMYDNLTKINNLIKSWKLKWDNYIYLWNKLENILLVNYDQYNLYKNNINDINKNKINHDDIKNLNDSYNKIITYDINKEIDIIKNNINKYWNNLDNFISIQPFWSHDEFKESCSNNLYDFTSFINKQSENWIESSKSIKILLDVYVWKIDDAWKLLLFDELKKKKIINDSDIQLINNLILSKKTLKSAIDFINNPKNIEKQYEYYKNATQLIFDINKKEAELKTLLLNKKAWYYNTNSVSIIDKIVEHNIQIEIASYDSECQWFFNKLLKNKNIVDQALYDLKIIENYNLWYTNLEKWELLYDLIQNYFYILNNTNSKFSSFIIK